MKIIADMHTHTVASTHAFSTVKEMAQEAADKGLEFIAITDHSPGSTDAPHVWHFHNLRKAVPNELFGVTIVYGVEASVVDFEGNIDFPENECAMLDWVIGSVHTSVFSGGTAEQNTGIYIGLAKNPQVDVIGHCATVSVPFDYEKGIRAFKEYDKIVEINENTLIWKNSRDNYKKIIPLCKKYGVSVMLNTDAHFYTAVGDVTEAMKLLEEFDYPKELIVNADRKLLTERLNRKNNRKFG